MNYKNVIDKIWETPELGFEEFKSAKVLVNYMNENDFKTQTGIAGMETAFVSEYGCGKPIIAFLAEYDALSGMNQEADNSKYQPITKAEDNGHGCGHNLLGAGACLAAIQYKNYLKNNDLKGTVKLYGCPGEESGSGKAFLARDGFFKDDDIALTWHPATINKVSSGSSLSCIQVYFRFYGVSSHAAGAPHLGRSALDAVELMNVGVNYMREHMESTDRVHYAITNSGGESPNVVQSFAEVRYFIRSTDNFKVQKLYERVCNIAKGASLMTECRQETIFFEGLSNLVPNFKLESVLDDAFKNTKLPEYTLEELEYLQNFKDSYDISSVLSQSFEEVIDSERLIENIKNHPVNNYYVETKSYEKSDMGSTDVGDTSWIIPTAQINTACYSYGAGGHTFQWVAQGKSSTAKKSVQYAADVLTKAAVNLYVDQNLIKEAKIEFDKRTKAGYLCLIPKNAKPENIN
jgi:aminobenzoyl-glutamate utilization protein B